MFEHEAYTDEQLAELLQNEEKDELWELLYSRYISKIRRLAAGFGSQGDSQELEAQGLHALLGAARSYDAAKGASFSTYFAVCAKNSMLNAIRRSQSKSRVPQSALVPLDEQSQIADDYPTPEQLALYRNEAQRILSAAERVLTEKERRAFELYIQGYKYSFIAQSLGVTEKAVEGALKRAKKKLREI